jgi:hypothetical protein
VKDERFCTFPSDKANPQAHRNEQDEPPGWGLSVARATPARENVSTQEMKKRQKIPIPEPHALARALSS